MAVLSKPSVLIVDDDAAFRDALARALRSSYSVATVASADEARRRVHPPPDVALVDLCLSDVVSDNREGLTLLKEFQALMPAMPVVIITAYGDIDVAVECMRGGASDFLQKRADIREVRARLDRAVEQGKQLRRVRDLEEDLDLLQPRRIVGDSERMREVGRMIDLVGEDGNATVLVRGETGTGKELVARAVHARGRRRRESFVAVMLNAIPQALVESEVFGHEAGAFTDARARRIGCLERAHGGILFLDEIGDVEPAIQAKLLRFLEEREFQRLGGSDPIASDVQVMAATNVNLEARVKDGRFRADLFYRLQVCEIHLPPLRERREDIPPLIDHFLAIFRKQGKRVHRIAPDAALRLREAQWPGNVRELRNVIESALFRAELHGHTRVETTDLPASILVGAAAENDQAGAFNVEDALHRAELTYIEEALRAAGGRKSEAWRLLGYRNREGLYRRVRIIARRSPELLAAFPAVQAQFGRVRQEKE